MRYMEPGLGYHYPAGTPAPRTEYGTAACEACDFTVSAQLIHDLGTTDLVAKGVGMEGACPRCGYDAPPLRFTRDPHPTPEDYL